MARIEIDNGNSGLVARNAINGMTNELYAAINVPIKFSASANITYGLAANTFLETVCVSVVSGTPTIKLGTISDAADLISEQTLNGFNVFKIESYYASAQTIYFTVSGGVINIRLNLTNSCV